MPPEAEQRYGEMRPCLPSPMELLHDERLARVGVRLWLKRDDLIDPEMPGNKWRKLRYNLEAARAQAHDALLTFGGAYSNHIRATAAAGWYEGFRTIGVIRGEEHLPLNDSLAYAVSRGILLAYLDRQRYRQKTDPAVLDQLREKFGRFYLIPEGGSNALGVRGCAELPDEIDTAYDIICCACGTGTTLAGIASGLRPGQRALGVAVLKGARYLDGEVGRLQREAFGRVTGNWRITHEFHNGGYAKRSADLSRFVDDFAARHGFTPDWIYEGKLLHGLFTLAERGTFPPGTTLVAVIAG